MRLRRGYLLLPILILILAGCYRQAGDSFEPLEQSPAGVTAPDTSDDADIADIDELPFDDVDDIDDADADDSAPGPAVTMIESTPFTLATNTPFPADADDDQDDAGVPQTVPDTDDADASTTDPVPLFSPTPTATLVPTLITPGAPDVPGIVGTTAPDDNGVPATATPSGLITPTDVFAGDDECIYIVQGGDNLFRIAINNDTTLPELRAANPQIRGDLIQPGDRLNIPNCTPGTTAQQPAPPPDTDTSGPVDVAPIDGDQGIVQPSGETIHVVQAGETLQIIARQYNTTITAIAQANNLANPNRLSVGQELVIPPPN